MTRQPNTRAWTNDWREVYADYPYQPPERRYQDTILAFRDAQLAGIWAARVEPDPLGPVNKIVTLMRGQRRVKSVLTRVPAGANVRVVRDEGGWTMQEVFALRERIWDSRGRGEQPELPPVHEPGWRIEIDGRTVLAVTDAELAPPCAPPPPPPLWRRMRTALREQLRADVDAVAKRLGFHRIEDCGGWDE